MGNVTIRQIAYDFVFDFNRNYVSIFYRFRYIAGYLPNVDDFDSHLHLAPSQGMTPVEFRRDLWLQKTRVPGLLQLQNQRPKCRQQPRLVNYCNQNFRPVCQQQPRTSNTASIELETRMPVVATSRRLLQLYNQTQMPVVASSPRLLQLQNQRAECRQKPPLFDYCNCRTTLWVKDTTPYSCT